MAEFKAIKAENLTKYYGGFLAVDRINFHVEQGELFGFLGPNGAGKSTTIRMLTGISTPTEGSAEILGLDIVKQPVEAKSLMGIVPDISNIYTELTAWENLDFTGRLYSVPKALREKRVEGLLDRFDLYDRRHEKVEAFSRGLRRRVCIAMALVHDMRVLFLDEPTSGLDVKSVRGIRQLVRELNDEGHTIFLTTHNIEEASQMCDRVAIINRGRIAAIDTPERLKKAMKSNQAIEVAFSRTSPELVERLGSLSSVIEVRKMGDKLHLLTQDPPRTLKELGSLISEDEVEPLSLNTLGPTLEDIFVEITGREMLKEVIHRKGGRKG